MTNTQKESKEELTEIESDYPSYRPMTLWVILSSAILLILIGTCMAILNAHIVGMEVRGGIPVITAPFLLFWGFAAAIFPIYHLIKQRRRKR